MADPHIQATPGRRAESSAGPLFAFRDGKLLVTEGGKAPVASPEGLGLAPRFVRDLGEGGGTAAWLGDDAQAPDGMVFRDLRGLLMQIDEGLLLAAGRAKQIVDWHVTHRFCGRCGAETVPGVEPLAKRCPRCGMVFYPRISPAVIVLVRNGDRVLLARSPGFPEGMYSILAGFVEPGESIEATIEREVCEETGVEVANVRYFGSQPWPFPNSLMIGCTAEYARGDLTVDPDELEDAAWFGRDDLPDLPPRASIARRMIDAFIEGSIA